jgi:monovalent cation/proton antiporter MnhG/PhaG subunit
MSIANIAVESLLAVAVVVALICAVALLAMRDFFEKLHYMAAVAAVSGLSVLIAVVIKEGAGQAAIKMSLILVLLLIMNAVVTHATARAARIRTFGTWSADPDTPVPHAGKGIGQELSRKAEELNEC